MIEIPDYFEICEEDVMAAERDFNMTDSYMNELGEFLLQEILYGDAIQHDASA